MKRFLIYFIFFTLISGFFGTKACFSALLGMMFVYVLNYCDKK